MKTDARIARFGGCVRFDSQPDKATVPVHPHTAKLYMISVDAAGLASVILPRVAVDKLRPGLCVVVENHGAGGSGSVEFLGADGSGLLLLDSSSAVAPGNHAFVYLTGFDGSGDPEWTIISRTSGPRAAL